MRGAGGRGRGVQGGGGVREGVGGRGGRGQGEGGDGHTGSLRPARRGSRTLLCDQSGHSPSCAACPCCDVTLSDDDIYTVSDGRLVRGWAR